MAKSLYILLYALWISLAGCNAIDAGSDEATIRLRIDEIIHTGDSPDAVRIAFSTLAEPRTERPMKLERTQPGMLSGDEQGEGCDYMMVGYLDSRPVYLVCALWGYVTFYFDRDEHLTKYRVFNRLFMGP